MSSYYTKARIKKDKKCKDFKSAMMIDDYFGLHQYGVKIDGYSKVFKPEECEFENK